MGRYIYEGPVVMFGKVVDDNFKGVTVAVNKKRALANLAYQWKKRNGYLPGSARLGFPGALREE